MHDLLIELPEIINRGFDVLELLVLRSTLLGLVILGAYSLLHKEPTETEESAKGVSRKRPH